MYLDETYEISLIKENIGKTEIKSPIYQIVCGFLQIYLHKHLYTIKGLFSWFHSLHMKTNEWIGTILLLSKEQLIHLNISSKRNIFCLKLL